MPRQLVEIWRSWGPDQALPDELPEDLIQFYRACSGRRWQTGRQGSASR